MLPCGLLVLLFVYDLDAALRAPVCSSPDELGGWCLPIGWEGPFSDFWGNRSRANTIANAALNLGMVVLAFALCVFVMLRASGRHSVGFSLASIQIGLLILLIGKGVTFNEYS